MHIVLNADENYMKYLAVLCWSVVAEARSSFGGGGRLEARKDAPAFSFHILTDSISSRMRERFQIFEAELNALYPCSFHFYVLEKRLFESFRELNGNHLTYFRLKMAEILPPSIKRCLYLDVDMLCVSDLREIFALDLQGKLCGAVLDVHYLPYRCVNARSPQQQNITLNPQTYFNAGLMLIDLERWRDEDIGRRSFELLCSHDPTWHDQDTLNALLSEDVLLLPLKWNFMLGHFLFHNIRFSDASPKTQFGKWDYTLAYTQDQCLEARKEMKILHFLTGRKPWNPEAFWEHSELASQCFKQWWDRALETPVFADELACKSVFWSNPKWSTQEVGVSMPCPCHEK